MLKTKGIFIRLTVEQVELLDKLAMLTGLNRSKLIQMAVSDYVPARIGSYERYFRSKGLDAYTLMPLPKDERARLGIGDNWSREIQRINLDRRYENTNRN